MSGSDGKARGLTNYEREEVAKIINKWKCAADGSYKENYCRALVKFAHDSNEILVRFEREDQSKKPAEDA